VRLRFLALVAVGLALPLSAYSADVEHKKPAIQVTFAERNELQVDLAFVVEEGMSDDALERLRSGLDVKQRHSIDLVTRRSAVWPAKIQARMRIETLARYDSLTARYELTRKVRRSVRKRKYETAVDERKSTESIGEVIEWMTRFDDLPSLQLAAEVGDPALKLRIDSTLGARFLWYVFPARLMVSTEHRLER